MLNRHLIAYLPVYLAQAIVGFGGVVVFTRILTPDEYGQYSLILVAASLIGTALFSWLDAAVARFHARAAARGRFKPHFATAIRVYLFLGVATAALLGVAIAFSPLSPAMKSASGFAVGHLVIRSALSLSLVTRRAAGEAVRYSILQSLTLVGGFALGIVFTLAGGLGPAGPFAGMALAALIACLIDLPVLLSGAKPDRASGVRAMTFLAYGAPVAFSLMFEYLLSTGDRFVIAGFLGNAATGAYAAGYGIADRSLDIVFIWLGAAAGPLAITALETEGPAAARRVMKQAGALMGLIGFPAALGLALVAEPLARRVIAPEIAAQAAAIMPWIALAGLLNGLMTYYFHEAFILGRQPRAMALTMMAGAAFNLILNLFLVPAFGIAGAAIATVIAYAVSLLACALLGQRTFALPLPVADWIKAGAAAVIMGAAILALPEFGPALVDLVSRVAVGVGVFVPLALVFNIAGCRNFLPGIGRPLREVVS
jgi:O-antigen/teichoic acid export membrane protein